jgi:hypothetical protein
VDATVVDNEGSVDKDPQIVVRADVYIGHTKSGVVVFERELEGKVEVVATVVTSEVATKAVEWEELQRRQ